MILAQLHGPSEGGLSGQVILQLTGDIELSELTGRFIRTFPRGRMYNCEKAYAALCQSISHEVGHEMGTVASEFLRRIKCCHLMVKPPNKFLPKTFTRQSNQLRNFSLIELIT